jgi:hypothetical protein
MSSSIPPTSQHPDLNLLPANHATTHEHLLGVDERGGMSETDVDSPDDTMRERAAGSRVKLWLLLDANRRVVTGATVVVVFATLAALGAVGPVTLRDAMSQSDPVETAFQGLLTAIITGVTLVVSLNQLVLSQELGGVGDQRERMSGAMSFRRDVEDSVGAPLAPPEPAEFLRALLDSTAGSAEDLAAAAADSDDEQFTQHAETLAESIVGNANSVADRLDDAQFGTFDVLTAALDFNYSWKVYEARRLRQSHDSLSPAAEEALDDIVESLTFFGPAREHVKTLYFRWELVDLSRAMLYASVPALLVSVGMILYGNDPTVARGATLGVDNLVWLTSGAVAVAVLPFAFLLAYVLRIATVAKRTLAIGPFVLRDTELSADIDRKE